MNEWEKKMADLDQTLLDRLAQKVQHRPIAIAAVCWFCNDIRIACGSLITVAQNQAGGTA